jgi:hypothetical protein
LATLLEALLHCELRPFVSLTTNGLHLDRQLSMLSRFPPDRIQLSLHHLEEPEELERILHQLRTLRQLGLRAGVNVLLRRSQLAAARLAARRLWAAGLSAHDVVWCPQRGGEDQPEPTDLARVVDGPFQSTSCLLGCRKSPRFCSVDALGRAAYCSFTRARRTLSRFDAEGLAQALGELSLEACSVSSSEVGDL